jgi:hypothetical protein
MAGSSSASFPAQPRAERTVAGTARGPAAAGPPPLAARFASPPAPPLASPPATALPGTAPPATALPATAPPATAPPGTALPGTALPVTAGWWTYADPAGFTIQLPRGWSAGSRTATHVTFTGPRAGFTVLVWWTTTPQPDQLTDWRQQAAYKAQTDPSYRQLAIQRVSYRGYNCANWEFSSSYQGQAIHVLDRGFIVTPGALAYAIELYGPQASWRSIRAGTWTGLLDSFTPAS